MHCRLEVYQNKAGNDILHRLSECGCAEDIVIIADLIISQTIKSNLLQAAGGHAWSASVDLDLSSVANIVHPAGSGPSPHAEAKARLRYKSRLDAAYSILHSLEDPVCMISSAYIDGSVYHLQVDYGFLKQLEESRVPSPLIAHSNLYRFQRKQSAHAFAVNRFLLLDRKMNYSQRQDEYDMPFSLLQKFTSLPSQEVSTLDSRGWKRGRTSWVDHVLKPAVNGCGIYKVVRVTDSSVRIQVSEDQLAAEVQKSQQL